MNQLTCPLSMISGKPTTCRRDCAYCIPEDIHEVAKNAESLQYLECLNLPDDMFGTGLAESGLSEIASAIREQ